jgi:hypothetical protein
MEGVHSEKHENFSLSQFFHHDRFVTVVFCLPLQVGPLPSPFTGQRTATPCSHARSAKMAVIMGVGEGVFSLVIIGCVGGYGRVDPRDVYRPFRMQAVCQIPTTLRSSLTFPSPPPSPTFSTQTRILGGVPPEPGDRAGSVRTSLRMLSHRSPLMGGDSVLNDSNASHSSLARKSDPVPTPLSTVAFPSAPPSRT